MNIYGDWWSTTITLYNRVSDENGKVTWYKTVIPECFYSHTVDTIAINNTILTSDVSICRIKVNDAFVSKHTFLSMSEQDRVSHFTLSANDIIVADEIDFNINEYVKGSRSSDLLKLFKEDPGCFTIKQASNNTGPGRGCEHYFARGV